jgi:uncharacterized protein YkwD
MAKTHVSAKRGSALGDILVLIIMALLAVFVYRYIQLSGGNIPGITNPITFPSTTIPYQSQNQSLQNTTTATTTIMPASQIDSYVLSLINRDRQQYGLQNVTLSSEQSGQQHSESMLSNEYFSHWDIYGMKPYMRYTLLGGTGAVSENVAFRSSYICTLTLCSGSLNLTDALKGMEYSMMYNDSICCNNGHRDNILDPHHNQVSIGVAYDSGRAYLTEDFIDNYINWNGNPSYSNGQVSLYGATTGGYSLSQVTISYDQPVSAMSQEELNSTSSYSYGTQVAGVVSSPNYHYTNVTTIVADRYDTKGNIFDISFNISDITRTYGPGEYTLLIWLNGQGGNFIGSTYTIFIGSDGQAYVPSGI